MIRPGREPSLRLWPVLGRGLVLMATLLALAGVLEATRFGAVFDQSWIDREVRGQGLAGGLLYVATGALLTALGVPRQAVAFLGGYAYGFATGSLLALVATLFGAAAAYGYGRLCGHWLPAARSTRRLKGLEVFLAQRPFVLALMIRLFPLGNNLATNLLAGAAAVRAAPFLAGSALGYAPQTAIFALLGSGIQVEAPLRLGIAMVLFVLSSLLGVWLYQRFRQETPPAPPRDALPASAAPRSLRHENP